MKYAYSLILLLILCVCSDTLPDVFKTKSGLYGSKEGEFIARFPGKPKVHSVHFQQGQIEFDQFNFQYRVANEHLYNVSYLDYPHQLLKGWDLDLFFDQAIKSYASTIDNFIIQERYENNDSSFEKSITYILYPSIRGDNSYMKAKMLKRGNRIFCVFFACGRRQPEFSKIDGFLNSFRIYKAT